jgi:hypothetical protein
VATDVAAALTAGVADGGLEGGAVATDVVTDVADGGLEGGAGWEGAGVAGCVAGWAGGCAAGAVGRGRRRGSRAQRARGLGAGATDADAALTADVADGGLAGDVGVTPAVWSLVSSCLSGEGARVATVATDADAALMADAADGGLADGGVTHAVWSLVSSCLSGEGARVVAASSVPPVASFHGSGSRRAAGVSCQAVRWRSPVEMARPINSSLLSPRRTAGA